MSERSYGWFVVAGLGTLVLLTKVIFNAGGVEWFTTFTLGVLFALAMVWAIEADDTDPSLEKCSDCGWVVGTNTDCLPCTHHRSSV
jgi:hypothetical protein